MKRRLKLANAAPKLLELYRQDGMTLDQLMALCISDDHQAQLRVWEVTKGREWDRSPERLRQAMTAGEVALDSPLVQVVGVNAYEAAGGQVRRDLFSDQDDGYIVDVQLLRLLAEQRLDCTAAKVRAEGWGWVEVRLECQYHELSEFARAEKVRRPLMDAEQSKLDALTGDAEDLDRKLDAVYEQDDDGSADDAETERMAKRLSEVQAELRRLDAKFETWTADIMSLAGAIVTVERNGSIAVHRGLVRPQDRKAATKAVAAHAPSPHTSLSGTNESEPEPQGKNLSEALTRKLTAHRTLALQRVLADNTHVALAALAHNLVQRVLNHHRVVTALDVQARGCAQELSRLGEGGIETSRAWQELAQMQDAWGERIPGEPAKLLPWLIALPSSELCDLLALCAALTVNAVTSAPGDHPADPLATAVALEMADWWEPTPANYLRHVPKAAILDAVGDADSAEVAAPLAKLKKDELVAKAEALLDGKRWLPAILRSRQKPETQAPGLKVMASTAP